MKIPLMSIVGFFIVGSFAAMTKSNIVAIGSLVLVGMLLTLILGERHQDRIGIRPFVLRIATVAAGIYWGYSHTYSCVSINGIVGAIVATNPLNNGQSSTAIVIDALGQKALATGSGMIGQSFEVWKSSQSGPLEPCRLRITKLSGDSDPTRLSPALLGIMALRSATFRKISEVNYRLRGWLMATILGDVTDLYQDEIDWFRRTGLFHILVVSGFHVTIFAMVLNWLLEFPARLLYGVRLLPSQAWRPIASIGLILTSFGVVGYVWVLGFAPPAQRACILVLITAACRLFTGLPPLKTRLLAVIFIQVVVFPLGFVSTSTLLSWAAYIYVVGSNAAPARGYLARIIIGLGKLQFRIAVLSLALFANLSVIGIATNVIFVPFFSLAFFSGLGLVYSPQWARPIKIYLARIQELYLGGIAYFGDLTKRNEWLFLDGPPLSIQWAALACSAILFLNDLKNLTIADDEGGAVDL